MKSLLKCCFAVLILGWALNTTSQAQSTCDAYEDCMQDCVNAIQNCVSNNCSSGTCDANTINGVCVPAFNECSSTCASGYPGCK